MNLNELKKRSLDELKEEATKAGMKSAASGDPAQLLLEILRAHTKGGGSVSSSGTLEILSDGFGFLRGSKEDFSPSPQDIYVSPSQIRRFHLSTGDHVAGQVRPPKESERYFALLRVESINGQSADKATTTHGFSERSVMRADSRLAIAHEDTTSQLFDKLCPLGKGQRALLFAPPRSQGDGLLLKLANAAKHHADYDLTCIVVGQRPELVADYMSDSPGEVVCSVFDDPAQRHTQLVDAALDNAKRAADKGQDVLMLIDSLSRLASFASQATPGAQVALPGGLSARGMQTARRVLGTGRNLVGAGSITVIALLRDSGSAVDQYLRQELVDSANATIQLSAAAAAAGCSLPLAEDGYFNTDEPVILTEAERDALAKARKALASAGAKDEGAYHAALLALESGS